MPSGIQGRQRKGEKRGGKKERDVEGGWGGREADRGEREGEWKTEKGRKDEIAGVEGEWEKRWWRLHPAGHAGALS